tara:strand:- start:1226 stop:2926 length:1701 start_codon:yes stop_codon:yes gene_type:complete
MKKMKKIYFLLLNLFTLLTFAQGSIDFDTDLNWSSATSITSYGSHTYTDGVFSATGINILRNTVSATDGFPGANGIYSVRLKNDATSEFTITVASGGVGTFSFNARRWDGSPDTNFAVETSSDNGTTWVASSIINATVTTDSDWKLVSGVINSTNTNIQVRIKSNGTTERIMIDDFSWTSPSSNPSLIITSPSDNTLYAPSTTSAAVNLSISNFVVGNPGTGVDGHIHYTVNGNAQPMKYDTDPISLTGLTTGTYAVIVTLVDDNHTPIVPSVDATINFEIAAINVVANLAALRTDVTANGAGKYYEISSNPVITFARSATYRNQKYIQDATAGVLIDDVTGTISTVMVEGDAISGLKGQAILYNGLLELIPLENATVATSGNTITAEIVTAADINANVDAYESELVQINGTSFSAADGMVVFAVNTNYDLTDGTTIAFRSQFAEADYIGQVIPSAASSKLVLVGRFNTTPQVVARSLNDIALANNTFEKINGLSMYPNPISGNILSITSDLNASMSVSIFNILGREVVNATLVNNAVFIGNLNAGVYIVKITENGKTAALKLVVR